MNPDTVPVESLDTFVQLLSHWHASKVKVLEHMLTIPPGTEADLESFGTVVLSGDTHRGFVLGLSLALIELGTLPFVAEPTDA